MKFFRKMLRPEDRLVTKCTKAPRTLHQMNQLVLRFFTWMICLSLMHQGPDALAQLASYHYKEYSIDSLQKTNTSYKGQNAQKVRLLVLIAKTHEEDAKKGNDAADSAILLAQKLHLHLEKAAALHYKAGYLRKKGDLKAAIALLDTAKLINTKLNNYFGVSVNLIDLGRIYDDLDAKESALLATREALEIFKRNNDSIGEANAYNNFGAIYAQKQPDKALEYFLKALEINEKLSCIKCIGANLQNIGIAYLFSNNSEKALEYFKKAISLDSIQGKINSSGLLLQSLGAVYFNMHRYDEALKYFLRANERFIAKSEQLHLPTNINNIANAYTMLANYAKAMEFAQKSYSLSEKIGDKRSMISACNRIGILYNTLDEYSKALEYNQKALVLARELADKQLIARCLGSVGNVYFNLNNFKQAIEYHSNALQYNREIGNKKGMASNYTNLGNGYYGLSDYYNAFLNYHKAEVLYKEFSNQTSLAGIFLSFGNVCLYASDSVLLKLQIKPTEKFTKTFEFLEKAKNLSEETKALAVQKSILSSLTEAYEASGNYSKAYQTYKQYIQIRDSIEGSAVKRKIEQTEMQFAFEKKETELKYQQQLSAEQLQKQQILNKQQEQTLLLRTKEKELQRLAYLKEKSERQEKEKLLALTAKEKELQSAQMIALEKEASLQKAELVTRKQELKTKQAQRNLFMAGAFLMLLLAVSVFSGLKRTQKEKRISDSLRTQSDSLLHNILPVEVASELKQKGFSEAKLFQDVSVIFTDFIGFTSLAEELSPTELVNEIHKHFTAFDAIIEKHGLEKIKTIGDAYLAVCGLPNAKENHAYHTLLAALDIAKYMNSQTNTKFRVRVGVHSGPVVAGIVGVKKYAYDIWGDTVNTAARMEQHSEAGKVNISGATYRLVSHYFECAYRGKIDAKNKGQVDMYFVTKQINEIV